MQLEKEPELKAKTASQWTTWQGPVAAPISPKGVIDVLTFFWDPLGPLPHDQDIKRCLGLPSCGIFLLHVIVLRPTFCSPRRCCSVTIKGPFPTSPLTKTGNYRNRFVI